MNKKYKLLKNDTVKTSSGKILYRIEASVEFRNKEKGGYVEGEKNLSPNGSCWISGNAWVYDDAVVLDHSRVCGEAKVFNRAKILGASLISGDTKVYGNAVIDTNLSSGHHTGTFIYAKLIQELIKFNRIL